MDYYSSKAFDMVIVSLRLLYIFSCFLWLHISDADAKPTNFPPTIPIRIGKFENWATELKVPGLWIATPVNENDVVTLANWASENGYQLRASGFMHNWSPLTVTSDFDEKVVLVETTPNLNKIQPPKSITASQYAVTAQTGASMLQFLTFLESYRLGLYAVPAPGDITLGGVLAIGGHGTGVPFVGERIPPGQALGTVSNLVISFTAVVWDETSREFYLKTFQRSDVEAKAFLVNFGRTFITEVTLMVGPNYSLRCQSRMNITKAELFFPVPGPKTFSSFLDSSGRVETITFPFTNTPWLKVWTIEPKKPLSSRTVTKPFNYPFSDLIPEKVANLVVKITKGASALTPLIGVTQMTVARAGLSSTLSEDIWGQSKNLLLYIKPTTLRFTENGYAIMTERSSVQKVLSTFNTYFDNLVESYKNQGKYPFNGPMEIRATSIDTPGVVSNGDPPAFSAVHPDKEHPEYDTVVWLDILSIPKTPFLNEAMKKLETFVLREYSGAYATVRPEWSKGWAYTNSSAWSDAVFIRNFLPSMFPNSTTSDGWNWAVQTLDKYDPNRIFTNPFIEELLQTV